jgi:hypothetical protein
MTLPKCVPGAPCTLREKPPMATLSCLCGRWLLPRQPNAVLLLVDIAGRPRGRQTTFHAVIIHYRTAGVNICRVMASPRGPKPDSGAGFIGRGKCREKCLQGFRGGFCAVSLGLESKHLIEYGNKVTDAAANHKQMPDAVKVGHFLVQAEKQRAGRVENPAGQ